VGNVNTYSKAIQNEVSLDGCDPHTDCSHIGGLRSRSTTSFVRIRDTRWNHQSLGRTERNLSGDTSGSRLSHQSPLLQPRHISVCGRWLGESVGCEDAYFTTEHVVGYTYHKSCNTGRQGGHCWRRGGQNVGSVNWDYDLGNRYWTTGEYDRVEG